MKNLFKNLMLVAVAAMAFTACQNDNNEINEVNRVTRYEFTANIADDTRSGFAEKEEGATAYKSEWFGNETLKLFVTDYNGYYVETTATVNTEGEFTLELENAPESFFMTVVSPAESWVSEYTANIPTEQTPLANSVDPKAHVLQSSTLPISGDSASIAMSPQGACYGKMTVNAPDFEIAKVEVSFNGGQVYTINAKNVENNVFWFAVGSMIDVSTFTVTAYDAENNAITKTVDVAAAGKTLKFQWGRVSTFSVSGLEAPAVPEEPEVPAFTSAVVVTDWGPFDQVISFYGEALGTLEVEFYNPDVEILSSDNWLKEGEYSLVEGTRNQLWYANFTDATHNEATVVDITITVAWVNGKYHITFENVGGYNYETFFESAVFVGSITGGSIEDPDSRTRLDKPVVEAVPSEVEPAITFSWKAVDNAIEYELIFDGQTYTTTELSKTFSGLDYFKTYEVSVVAVADVNSETYRNSEAVIAKARTMKDPNGPEVDPNAFTSCNYVASFDSEGWGRKYEFSNESGAYLWLWVVQTAADEFTGFMNSGIYNYHNSWADSVSYPGFVVKRMVLPGSSEESYIIGANMSVERNGDNHEIAFDITLEGETEPRTYTFSGAINKTF